MTATVTQTADFGGGVLTQALRWECRLLGRKFGGGPDADSEARAVSAAQEEARYHDEAYHPNGEPGDFGEEAPDA